MTITTTTMNMPVATYLIKFAWVLLATYSNSFLIAFGMFPSTVLVIDDGSMGRFSNGIVTGWTWTKVYTSIFFDVS